MLPTDDGGHIPAIYGDFIEVFRNAKAETLPPHRSIDHAINLETSYNLPYGRIYNISELDGAIFTQSRGLRSRAQEPGHGFGFGIKDPMPCGQIDEWVYLTMNDMSLNYWTAMKSQWMTDITEVSK
jgi:hypothetical protein